MKHIYEEKHHFKNNLITKQFTQWKYLKNLLLLLISKISLEINCQIKKQSIYQLMCPEKAATSDSSLSASSSSCSVRKVLLFRRFAKFNAT